MRFRTFVFPLLLAALTLRVLIPSDVVPTADGLKLQATVCSNERGKTEVIEIPGEESTAPHCAYCVAPLLGAPLAMTHPALSFPNASSDLPELASQTLASPLRRAQSARAPPALS
jgi:hypothetical protein